MGVLHPRLLSVYSIQRRGKGTVGGDAALPENAKPSKLLELDSFQLTLAYQHKLARSAYAMVIGRFGRVINKEFICVQVY